MKDATDSICSVVTWTNHLSFFLNVLPHTSEQAKLSKLVCEFDEIYDFEEAKFTCKKVSSNCLAKVVEFLNHYEREPMKTIATPLIDHTFEGVVKQKWYRDYVKLDGQLLSQLLNAAHYMDIGE